MISIVPNWISVVLDQNSSSSVFGVQSSLGNKRKWVSLPLEEASRDDGDKTPGGGPDTEPTSDSPDPTSPNHTLHNNRAHDSSRSKWPAALCFLFISFFTFSLCFVSSLAGLASLFALLFMFALHFSPVPSVFTEPASFSSILMNSRMKACVQIYR